MPSTQKAVRVVSFMLVATLLAKALGLVRSMALAAIYGTGESATAILTASRIPLLFFDIAFGAAILSCFIPIYSGFLATKGEERADRFSANFLALVLLITILMSALGSVFSEQIIGFITPGLEASTRHLAASLASHMFPMTVMTGVAFTFVGVLQSKGQFLAPSLISAVSNGVIIIYLLTVGDGLGVYGVGAAYVAAWLCQVLFLLPFLKKVNYRFGLRLKPVDEGTKKAARMALPVLVSSWLQPAITLLNMYFASFIKGGQAVPALDYANNLYLIAAGVITYGITNYLFPTVAAQIAKNEVTQAGESVRTSLSSLLLIVFPVLAAFAALSPQIVTVLYARGAFDFPSVQMTSNALAFFALGMAGFAITEVLNRTFYAMKDAKFPMAAAVVGIVLNALFCYLFVSVLGLQEGAVAAAGAIGQTVTALILCVMVQKRLPPFSARYAKKILAIALCAAASFGVMWAIKGAVVSSGFMASGFLEGLAICLISFIPGFLVFAFLVTVFRIEEALIAKELIRRLLKRGAAS